jgi:hypothetical protein
LLIALAAASLLATPTAGARRADTPGVTATRIVLGGTGTLTGAESQYQPVLSVAQAYLSNTGDGTIYGRVVRTFLVRYLHGYWNVPGKPLATS